MLIIAWFILIVEVLFFYLIKSFVNNADFYATLLILINIPLVILSFLKYKKNMFFLFFIGFLIRLFLMYLDIFGSDYLILPHSGGDSVGFYRSALTIAQTPQLITENIYGGLYSKVLGLVLFFGPTSRIILQYINILLTMSTILLVYKIMNQLNISVKLKKYMIILMLFFPSSIIFSSILLRESYIIFTIVLSFYFFLKWLFGSEIKFAFLSFIVVLIGALFHSGVISLIVGYFFMLLFFKPESGKFKSSLQTVLVFSLILFGFLYLNFTSIENIPFLGKFKVLEESDNSLYDVVSGGRGGSVYLSNINITNPVEMFIFSPIKMLYFLVSPVPLDWRGLADIGTFFYDSIIYGILFFYPILNYRKMIKGDPIAITLFLMILGFVFVFGIGLNNAGTAMRHRYKIFYLLIILFSLGIRNKKMNYLYYKRS